jgi:hypothetical protein
VLGDRAVKNKTALNHATASAKVSAILIAAILALTFKYPTAHTIVPLVILVFFFQMEVVIVLRIRPKALQDPTYLDQQLKDKHGRSL